LEDSLKNEIDGKVAG
jgi:hypothetical protein